MRVGLRACPMHAVVAGLLVAACGQSKAPDDAPALPTEVARVKTAAEALQGAHVPTLDPATLNDAEIRKLIGDGRHCAFRYTSSGRPVLLARLKADGSPDAGLVKLNGNLVSLEPSAGAGESAPGGFSLAASPVRLTVQRLGSASGSTDRQQVEANMVFEVGQRLKVGYGGFLTCTSRPAQIG